jgi:hypothetical protein
MVNNLVNSYMPIVDVSYSRNTDIKPGKMNEVWINKILGEKTLKGEKYL